MDGLTSIRPPFVIPVEDGFIVPIEVEEGWFGVNDLDFSFSIQGYGVDAEIGGVTLPISLAGIDHLIENGSNIYFYGTTETSYMCDYIAHKIINRDQLLILLGRWEALHGS